MTTKTTENAAELVARTTRTYGAIEGEQLAEIMTLAGAIKRATDLGVPVAKVAQMAETLHQIAATLKDAAGPDIQGAGWLESKQADHVHELAGWLTYARQQASAQWTEAQARNAIRSTTR